MKRSNRTWLCSVLFMDIVDYSELPVDQQMLVKQSFSITVADALRGLPAEDCIKLDTGDGLALCYLGAPEDVLYVGVGMRDNFNDVNSICKTCYTVRMGINLGPVKIFEDINGQRNTIGDGINTAQRIMSFAQPNQLLVSRAYFDVVSCLSDELKKMFSYTGIHNDKHVREHAVYEVTKHGNYGAAMTEALADSRANNADVSHAYGSGMDLDEKILKTVQEQLARIVGPMAEILIKRAVTKSSNLEHLYQILAEEITSETERAQFLESKDRLH
ncbi:MAG: adenylate/guanylate cyclase domain-containing protein [Gammaproteobacteria bacterium]